MPQINGDWFRRKLTEKNRSQRALAKHLDLDPGAITLTLRGDRRLQMHEAEQIAVFLGEPLEDVLRAAGMPIGQPAPPRQPDSSDPVQALRAKRDELLAEVDTLNKAIALFEK